MELTREILASKDREMAELRRQQTALLTAKPQDGSLRDVLAPLLSNTEQAREELREERRLAEQRLVEERRIAEAKINAEREERRAEREEERRRWEAEREERRQERLEEQRRWEAKLEEDRRKHEKEMELIRQQMKDKEAAELERAKLQMQMMSDVERKKEEAAREAQKFMLDMVVKNNETVTARLESQSQQQQEFLLKQLEAKESGFEKQLAMFSKVKDLFAKDDGDDRETWEKVMDKGAEIVPGIFAGAQQILTQRRGAGVSAATGPAPGTVAIAELPAARSHRPRRNPSAAPAEAPPATQGAPAPAAASGEPPNPFEEFAFPSPIMDLQDSFRMLIQDIDLAVQRDMDPEDVWDEVVAKFPPGVVELLRAIPTDKIKETIVGAVPASWAIRSLEGLDLVEELHALVKERRA